MRMWFGVDLEGLTLYIRTSGSACMELTLSSSLHFFHGSLPKYPGAREFSTGFGRLSNHLVDAIHFFRLDGDNTAEFVSLKITT